MLFNSGAFLIFFPAVTTAYFLLPRCARMPWLLVCSYYFYLCWNPKYILLLAGCTLVTYAAARLLTGKSGGIRRGILIAGLSFNLLVLFFFKYYAFGTGLLARLFSFAGWRWSPPHFDPVLPVGISFYVFQALGYLIDVYRGDIPAERSLPRYALFVSFFPQLVAGPIERSRSLLAQLEEPKEFDFERLRDGLALMALGYFEKLVIADRAAVYVDSVYSAWQRASGWQISLATVLFAVQIYCDFGGYSHIAIGAARILGIRLMDNFRQPYFAASVREFWRRWHISLSTWFRDYVYIPLGGSRVSCPRAAANTLATFLLSGLWHGASLNFAVWGLLNGLLQVAEGLFPRQEANTSAGRLLRTLRTFLLVCLTWVFFRARALTTACRMLLRIFTHFGAAPMKTGMPVPQAAVLAVSVLLLFAVDLLRERGFDWERALPRRPYPLRGLLLLLAALLIVVFGHWGPDYSAAAFIYFQF